MQTDTTGLDIDVDGLTKKLNDKIINNYHTPEPIVKSKPKTTDQIRAGIIKRLAEYGFENRNAKDYSMIVEAFTAILSTPGRGALITGSVGCGKTFAMHAIIKAFTIECFDAEQLSKLTMDQQEHQVHDYLRFNNDMFLDDIGSEDVVSSYGNKQNIVADFLINWHTHMVKIPVEKRARLFITTNLPAWPPQSKPGKKPPQSLENKYGLRVLDRVAEICDLIEMSGKSQRRAWKKYGG